MIPVVDTDLLSLTVATQPTKTYRLNLTTDRIQGTATGLEAMQQAVYLILNTERYKHMLYSWNYGVELSDLIGQSKDLVMPACKRFIQEGLLQDDRITSVDNFVFTPSRKSLHVAFTVHTTVGDVDTDTEVNY